MANHPFNREIPCCEEPEISKVHLATPQASPKEMPGEFARKVLNDTDAPNPAAQAEPKGETSER